MNNKLTPTKKLRFFANEDGAIMVETALASLLLTIIFFGLVEVASLIKVRERMNRAAGDMTQLLSTTPVWSVANHVAPVIAQAGLITAPYGARFSIAFCDLNLGTVASFSTVTQGQRGPGDCSLGKKSTGAPDATVNCNQAGVGPAQQFVVVKASCAYSTYLSTYLYSGSNVITSVAYAPMRNTMLWGPMPSQVPPPRVP